VSLPGFFHLFFFSSDLGLHALALLVPKPRDWPLRAFPAVRILPFRIICRIADGFMLREYGGPEGRVRTFFPSMQQQTNQRRSALCR
jgi:hypothetical protein